jgi:hypothetical protein
VTSHSVDHVEFMVCTGLPCLKRYIGIQDLLLGHVTRESLPALKHVSVTVDRDLIRSLEETD